MKFKINQIVRGKFAGVFVILNRVFYCGEYYYDLKEVNPDNLGQTASGGLRLPESALRFYN